MPLVVGFVDQPLSRHRRINGLLSGRRFRPAVARGGVGVHVAAHLRADRELGLRRQPPEGVVGVFDRGVAADLAHKVPVPTVGLVNVY